MSRSFSIAITLIEILASHSIHQLLTRKCTIDSTSTKQEYQVLSTICNHSHFE